MKTILKQKVDDMIERIEHRISQLNKHIDEYKNENRIDEAVKSDIKRKTFELILTDLKSFVPDKESERQTSTEVSEQHDSKALHIADVVRSFSKQDMIDVLQQRKDELHTAHKYERERLTQAINTIKKIVPDF